MSGEDVYDVARAPWCELCQAEHRPCEIDDEGIEHVGLGEEEDPDD